MRGKKAKQLKKLFEKIIGKEEQTKNNWKTFKINYKKMSKKEKSILEL